MGGAYHVRASRSPPGCSSFLEPPAWSSFGAGTRTAPSSYSARWPTWYEISAHWPRTDRV